jgi:hypothetical protein
MASFTISALSFSSMYILLSRAFLASSYFMRASIDPFKGIHDLTVGKIRTSHAELL